MAGCAEAGPAKAARKPALTNYHGVVVADDYQWLEDETNAEVQSWTQTQHLMARAYLDRLPARSAIEERIEELFEHASSDYYGARAGGGVIYCLRLKPPASQAALVRIVSLSTRASEFVLNPNQLDTNGTTRIEFFQPSLDGKLVAVCLSEPGVAGGTLTVYDGGTGHRHSDVISRVSFPGGGGSVAWDEQGFYYTRYPRVGERPESELRLFPQVYYHRLGTSEAEDRYEAGRDWPRIAQIKLKTAPDRQHLLASVAHGRGGATAHWLRLPSGHWRSLAGFEDGVTQVDFGHDPLYIEWPADPFLYFLSFKPATHGRILKTPLAQPDFSHAHEIVKESEKPIQNFVLTASGLFIQYVDGGPTETHFHDFYAKAEPRDTKDDEMTGDEEKEDKDEAEAKDSEELAEETPEPAARGGWRRESERGARQEWKVELPGLLAVQEALCVGGDLLLFRVSRYAHPPAWWSYDPIRNRTRIGITPFGTLSAVSFSDVETLRVFATSKDGTRVPMSIVRRKGIRLTGDNPTLLTGASGFGVSLAPGFDFTRRVWLDQGGLIAVANVRGGGEYGESWHWAGSLTNKQSAFDDFIACAEFLIRSNYSNPGKLAIQDVGEPGPLMGAALTQRPDLFRAVVTQAGEFDLLRAELEPEGAYRTGEFGSTAQLDQFRALHAYSPYHHVVNRTAYPGVLLMPGEEADLDSRKMVARLQTASSSRHPVLLRAGDSDGAAGRHGFAERLAKLVDIYSFLFDQLGVEYSQVARGPWAGAVTPTSAVVKARLARAGLEARLALSTSPLLTSPVYTVPMRSDTNQNDVVAFQLEQLRPDTLYHYALEVGGRLDRVRRGQFRTFPVGPASFSFAYASCARTASTSGVFDTIRENHPLFFLHTGDFHYENIQTNDLARFHAAYDRVLFSPEQGDLYRSAPIVYVWDDHDFGGNNANRRAGSHDVARRAYDEYVPHYPLLAGDTGPIYQSFSVGRVKFIVTDLRSERDPSTNRDDAKKSMMGDQQKEWFKNELLSANGHYPLICWVSSVPWIGTKGSNYYRVATNVFGYLHHTTVTNVPDPRAARRSRPPGSEEDQWSVYSTERREIADFIKSNHIQGVCILHGDSHMLAADDGSNSDYATGGGAPIPVMCGAPLDQQASLKGGPYSQGVYKVNFQKGEGAFGWVTIVDRRDEIELRYSGRNLRNEEKISLRFTVPARGMSP